MSGSFAYVYSDPFLAGGGSYGSPYSGMNYDWGTGESGYWDYGLGDSWGGSGWGGGGSTYNYDYLNDPYNYFYDPGPLYGTEAVTVSEYVAPEIPAYDYSQVDYSGWIDPGWEQFQPPDISDPVDYSGDVEEVTVTEYVAPPVMAVDTDSWSWDDFSGAAFQPQIFEDELPVEAVTVTQEVEPPVRRDITPFDIGASIPPINPMDAWWQPPPLPTARGPIPNQPKSSVPKPPAAAPAPARSAGGGGSGGSSSSQNKTTATTTTNNRNNQSAVTQRQMDQLRQLTTQQLQNMLNDPRLSPQQRQAVQGILAQRAQQARAAGGAAAQPKPGAQPAPAKLPVAAASFVGPLLIGAAVLTAWRLTRSKKTKRR